jgi:WD40 repeat protein
MAVAGTDGSVPLYDVATGRERATLRGHTDSIKTIAFSPDSSILGIGCADGTVKLLRTALEPDVLAQTHVRDRREEQAIKHSNAVHRLQSSSRYEEAEKACRQALDLYG